MKFLRKRLTQNQFIQATTSQYYGVMFYGSVVWLGIHTPKALVKKLNAAHYRFLRVATMDWKRRKKKKELDLIGLANPVQWFHYITASTVIKIMKNEEPKLLHESLTSTCYTEQRRPERFRFYDSSASRFGKDAICNRLTDIFKLIDFDHLNINDHLLRINLKKSFFKS